MKSDAEAIALLGGKGAEGGNSHPKGPLRCTHRWALVSRSAIREKAETLGTLLIQVCRWCGTFRASTFWPQVSGRGRIEVNYRVRYLKAEEGLRKVSFNPTEELQEEED